MAKHVLAQEAPLSDFDQLALRFAAVVFHELSKARTDIEKGAILDKCLDGAFQTAAVVMLRKANHDAKDVRPVMTRMIRKARAAMEKAMKAKQQEEETEQQGGDQG